MAEHLPLLVFPKAKSIDPEKRNGFPPSKPHFPSRSSQSARLSNQFDELAQNFANYKASISGAMSGLEPEVVLVIEIAGKVEDFKQAVEAVGLEWVGEWDIDEIEPFDDFYVLDSKNKPTKKPLGGRIFLSLGNEAGLNDLLSLWETWKQGKPLPHGKSKWADVFAQLIDIRRWGILETLRETGMIDRWQDFVDPLAPEQKISFQIELFYRSNSQVRKQNEKTIIFLLNSIGGSILSNFIDMPEIGFHAVKADLPAGMILQLLKSVENPNSGIDIDLFKFQGIMYFRPTGQSLVASGDEEGEPMGFPKGGGDLPPVGALLDGVPLLQHDALRDRLYFDDAFDLEPLYLPGERKHGTSMASLILHGDLNSLGEPLNRKVYCIPIMQPDPKSQHRNEHIPDEVFFEDRVFIAVRRMLEGDGALPPQAPDVKVVNLSIGDNERPFIHTPSPWARLLDWLSWKYRILFCVSAGNYSDTIDLEMNYPEFSELEPERKLRAAIKSISNNLSSRRLLSPSESINALTIGAQHADDSGEYPSYPERVDLMPCSSLFSPVMRVGYGFRRSIKPELLFPGGRQLYKKPVLDSITVYETDKSIGRPGQSVAVDSKESGNLSNVRYDRGTSNATAMATRGALQIYEMLELLKSQEQEDIPDSLVAVLMKTLLIHSASQPQDAKEYLAQSLKNETNSRRFKEVAARYLGYGIADVERVLACTERRATVLGCGEIGENEVHEYSFPMPISLSEQKLWRRLVVTLAWFSPINPSHRNLREAKLVLEPGGTNWGSSILKVDRQDSDHNQVLRGTSQHEVLESKNKIAAFQDGENLYIRVSCRKDATSRLDDIIPYGLAVTLEVKEDIPIYQQIKLKLKPQVKVGVS